MTLMSSAVSMVSPLLYAQPKKPTTDSHIKGTTVLLFGHILYKLTKERGNTPAFTCYTPGGAVIKIL